jgi:predicted TIM-barrel fold metal-dependent hydrolase
MSRCLVIAFTVLLALYLALSDIKAQTTADPALVAEILKIKAIDNHAHPSRLVSDGETDEEWDVFPFEGYEVAPPWTFPTRLRPSNPEYVGAWRALYGYRHDDMRDEHVRELLETKQRIMRERGDSYPSWVLDQLGIETMLANRVAMGRGLAAPRFRWVPYVDALMLPLNTEAIRRAHPKYRRFYEGEERMFKRFLVEAKLSGLPENLDEYMSKVISATLARQKRDGALAVKFEAAYLRPLDFAEAPGDEAARIYGQYAKGGEPPVADYKKLQDFLFRHIAREAGRLGLAVHLHVSAGAGAQFELSGSNPLLLDSVLNDISLSRTNFVIIHGGWPYTKEVAFLLNKPNVYADFSAQTFLLSPRKLSEVLRDWLEWYPEKVLFGTDVFPGAPQVNWEEMGWLTTSSARQALALALTGMVNDGLITRERALDLARMVLRENAIKLYNLKSS